MDCFKRKLEPETHTMHMPLEKHSTFWPNSMRILYAMYVYIYIIYYMYMNINIDIYMYTYQMVFDLLNQPHKMSWRTGISCIYIYTYIIILYIYITYT